MYFYDTIYEYKLLVYRYFIANWRSRARSFYIKIQLFIFYYTESGFY